MLYPTEECTEISSHSAPTLSSTCPPTHATSNSTQSANEHLWDCHRDSWWRDNLTCPKPRRYWKVDGEISRAVRIPDQHLQYGKICSDQVTWVECSTPPTAIPRVVWAGLQGCSAKPGRYVGSTPRAACSREWSLRRIRKALLKTTIKARGYRLHQNTHGWKPLAGWPVCRN